MRIAIVDDISEERTLLRNRLESQFSRRNVHVDIFEYENGETFLTSAKECPFTVVFLDIYMNGSNGIDTAKELRRSDTDCLLIFTTTSTDHALEGFQVRALHYLVKPYSENDISVLADEILSRIPDSGKYIDVKVNGSNIQIPFRKIIYAEHFSHMIHIHTDGERELVTRQTMEGYIGWEPEGENGFGYDPIFYLDEYGCSSAAISPEQKNAISHRGKALRAMKELLKKAEFLGLIDEIEKNI